MQCICDQVYCKLKEQILGHLGDPVSSQPPKPESFHSALLDLIAVDTIDQLVLDCVALVQSEVKKKRGLSGTMIKGGMKVIEKVRPNILADLFYSLLPSFIEALVPFYERYQTSKQSSGSFSDFLQAHATEVSDILLSVTDRRAKVSKLGVLVKVYQKLRPLAQDQIKVALPALAQLLNKHGIR